MDLLGDPPLEVVRISARSLAALSNFHHVTFDFVHPHSWEAVNPGCIRLDSFPAWSVNPTTFPIKPKRKARERNHSV